MYCFSNVLHRPMVEESLVVSPAEPPRALSASLCLAFETPNRVSSWCSAMSVGPAGRCRSRCRPPTPCLHRRPRQEIIKCECLLRSRPTVVEQWKHELSPGGTTDDRSLIIIIQLPSNQPRHGGQLTTMNCSLVWGSGDGYCLLQVAALPWPWGAKWIGSGQP